VEHAVEEVSNFYRVFHSMRFVDDKLVLRISQSLSSHKIEMLNTEFADILVTGTIEQTKALSHESSEPELAELPRLTMHYNRRSQGRLRQLINRINEPEA
jgi:DTW domain-containing protein YfiP